MEVRPGEECDGLLESEKPNTEARSESPHRTHGEEDEPRFNGPLTGKPARGLDARKGPVGRDEDCVRKPGRREGSGQRARPRRKRGRKQRAGKRV